MRAINPVRLFKKRNLARTLFFSLVLVLIILHINQPASLPAKIPAIQAPIVKQYDEAYYRLRLDSLRSAFGTNKTFSPDFELVALLALSHYPELAKERIHFMKVPQAMPLIASRPDPLNLFRSRQNWVYNIYISEEAPKKVVPDLLKNFTFNAQVGLMGHELAHTVSYLDKTSADMISIGLQYWLSDPYRAQFEQATDRRAIAHGLGWQVLEYSQRYRENTLLNREEIKSIDTYYMDPASVKRYMKSCGMYGEPTIVTFR